MRSWLAPVLAAMLASAIPSGALAGDPPDPGARAAAAAKFREGEAAFRRKDFRGAADAFAAAHALTGHPSPLFNEGIALEQAGERARAATCFATFLRLAPADEPRRPEATRRRDALATTLGAIEIVAPSATDIAIDGSAATPGDVYVDPGDHEVTGREGSRELRRRVTVPAGARTRVELTAAPEAAAPPAAPPAPAAPPDQGGSGLHPAWFFVGAGVSVALGAVTVWSGLDTNAAREDFEARPTVTAYDDGTAKVTRTNILLVATIATAVVTGAVGLFATDWSGGERRSAKRPTLTVSF